MSLCISWTGPLLFSLDLDQNNFKKLIINGPWKVVKIWADIARPLLPRKKLHPLSLIGQAGNLHACQSHSLINSSIGGGWTSQGTCIALVKLWGLLHWVLDRTWLIFSLHWYSYSGLVLCCFFFLWVHSFSKIVWGKTYNLFCVA